ncbi:hypothetical protein PGTUg99_022320 [Puccinia graminis f. sp. tritici]|uniref:Tyrosine specific protein phosphatases domain-containing protein n=2 Tax=Puccinia graminis f. sp. tritici TaxID=56615 RepID=E3JTT3_PUCGT|nr:uncharacterized protein PGTG_00746 [Puccinia graminis f. sp. tritici CRL 75-36-700-3]EFP75415.1 hypothetical protein PGTG_00746 [Puccinia graminis f. sp. tritici CRL 75-36-700-3]KAA1130460.1 hypothetical protein PGTUg99_022320 [Puccinia graminis f. sp. tritici]
MNNQQQQQQQTSLSGGQKYSMMVNQPSQQLHPIQHYLINRLSTTEQLSPNHFIKALPSPSPLVTPEMGERLCRMSSQHHLSDYNRFKRTPHPIQINQQQQLQQQQQPSKPHRQHRHHHNHHHHHHHQSQQQQQLPPLESLPIPTTTLLPLINQNPTLDHSSNQHGPDPILKQPNPLSAIPQPEEPIQPAQNENPQQPHPDQNSTRNIPLPPAQTDSENLSPVDPNLTGPSSDQQSHPPTTVPNGTPTPNHLLVKVQSVKTSQTHPMNISPVIPPELTSGLLYMLKTANHRAGSNKLPIDLYDLTSLEPEKAIEAFWQYHHQRVTNTQNRDEQAGGRREGSSSSSGEVVGGGGEELKLGNLLLSSCPGKKVRMNETAAQRQATGNHRSPICRDLKSDLSRAHSIGIRAIICCLDDEELEYLGSPWPDYSRISLECGLSVIRIPIAEGFAPQKGIKEVNEVLDQVIKTYTTQGIDVLCHCRGGVGRAGLVACCWMLKIGLINKPSLISDPSNHLPTADYHHPNQQAGFTTSNFQDQFHYQSHQHPHQQQQQAPVHDVFSFVDGHQLAPKNSVLGQVEKVIEVIRRRRSPKAIETPQQVHFIIQYANWLDTLTENVDLF